jgi:hypothetical protein
MLADELAHSRMGSDDERLPELVFPPPRLQFSAKAPIRKMQPVGTRIGPHGCSEGEGGARNVDALLQPLTP